MAKTVAIARARKLKVVTRHGATFLVLKLSKLVKGKLQFKAASAQAPSAVLTLRGVAVEPSASARVP